MPSSLRGRWPSKQAKNSSRLSFRAPSTSFSTSCQLKRSNSKNIRMARMANYIEMQLASKKNNMGQTSEGCQSLEFGGWTLFNKVFQPPNMKSTIHVLTKFFRSIAFCCQLGLSSSVLRSKTPGKCELCLELCWMFCLTNGAFNDFSFFLVYLTLFIWELTLSYSKGKNKKSTGKYFVASLGTMTNQTSQKVAHVFFIESSPGFLPKSLPEILTFIFSKSACHAMRRFLGFLSKDCLSETTLCSAGGNHFPPQSFVLLTGRAAGAKWWHEHNVSPDSCISRNLNVIHWQISGEMKTL